MSVEGPVLRDLLLRATGLTVSIIDLCALISIALGTAKAFVSVFFHVWHRRNSPDDAIRLAWLGYSRWLVAALTLQLAADILETSATPGWDDIGRLAAVAVIRTFLNYFLEKDLSELKDRQKARPDATAKSGSASI